MDTNRAGHQDDGNGTKQGTKDSPSAKGFDSAPLLASQGVETLGVGVASEDEPEEIEKPRKYTAKDGKTEIKHAAALILAENGMSYGAIGQAVERHPKHLAKILPVMKKHSLASPDMARLAKTGVKAVMQGFVGTKQKQQDGSIAVVTDRRVKASDMLKAAEMVQARYDPPEQAAPGSQSFLQINIGQYNPHE